MCLRNLTKIMLLGASWLLASTASAVDYDKMAREAPSSSDIWYQDVIVHRPNIDMNVETPLETVYRNLRRSLVKCNRYSTMHNAYYPEAGEADMEVRLGDNGVVRMIFRLKRINTNQTKVKGWAINELFTIGSARQDDLIKQTPVFIAKGDQISFQECEDMGFDISNDLIKQEEEPEEEP